MRYSCQRLDCYLRWEQLGAKCTHYAVGMVVGEWSQRGDGGQKNMRQESGSERVGRDAIIKSLSLPRDQMSHLHFAFGGESAGRRQQDPVPS